MKKQSLNGAWLLEIPGSDCAQERIRHRPCLREKRLTAGKQRVFSITDRRKAIVSHVG